VLRKDGKMRDKKIVTVGNTDFAVFDDHVQEVWTRRMWSPSHPSGWQETIDGRRVSLCSFGSFGADINAARKLADLWCKRARKAFETIN
jgi:hypothetical protein